MYTCTVLLSVCTFCTPGVHGYGYVRTVLLSVCTFCPPGVHVYDMYVQCVTVVWCVLYRQYMQSLRIEELRDVSKGPPPLPGEFNMDVGGV